MSQSLPVTFIERYRNGDREAVWHDLVALGPAVFHAPHYRSGRQAIAMIEVVSPGNKDGQQHFRQFVDKAVAAVWQGIHLLIVDLYPPGRFDLQGGAWSDLG